jgi:transposase
MDTIGILPTFEGTAVHDALGGYFQYGCRHSLCNAHLLRDLTAVSEATRQRPAPGSARGWPERLAALLGKIKAAVERARAAGQTHLAARSLRHFAEQYQQLLRTGLRANPPPKPTGRVGRPRQGLIRSLLLRLKNHQAVVLAFMHDFRVPPQGQQPGRTRLAHGQGAPEGVRWLPQLARGRELLPHSRVFVYYAQAGS